MILRYLLSSLFSPVVLPTQAENILPALWGTVFLLIEFDLSTLRFWTNPHKIKRKIYLKKLFDYEWTMSYEVSKNSKNLENI